ncbi:MAG: transpeptidase family protein [Deltaproteobacteria bacterium]|nr:transpeptidase family protein [Deltaproteobacteria bacterium]MCB9787862.1 transpeptidase family protein [Deltaproteobacteria bacterium]
MTDNRKARASRAPDKLTRPPETRLTSVRRRMILTGLGLFVGILAAFTQIAVLQTVEADALRAEAARNYQRTMALDDWRGDITDRDGQLLAVDVHRWAVTADPTHVDPAEAPHAARILGELIGVDVGETIDKLVGSRTDSPIDDTADPATRFARQAVRPAAEAVAAIFEFPVSRFERKMRLLEYFYRMDQLRTRGIYQLVDTLTRIAEVTAKAINAGAASLRFFPNRGKRFVYLARDIDDDAARSIYDARQRLFEECARVRDEGGECTNPLAAIQLQPEPHRYYPKRELATQFLGLVGTNSHALDGIERAMDGVLAGGHHLVEVIRDRRGRSMFLDGIPDDAPLAAPAVELTLDQQIQALAERELHHACLAAGARAGYAIVMAVKTGEVLAAASFPTFNPNTYREFYEDRQPLVDEREVLAQKREDLNWAATWPGLKNAFPGSAGVAIREAQASQARETNAFIEYEHHYPNAARHSALQGAYEPGSIMKVFTLAAWLDSAIHPLSWRYGLMDGAWHLEDAEDNVIHDDHHYDVESADVAYALKTSSNIVFGQMGVDLGAETLWKYLDAFGFGQATGSGFPGESAGRLRHGSEWKLVETANIAFGQGISATGLQLVTALAALANGGVRMRPLLVRRVVDAEGRELRRWDPAVVGRVVSEKAARTTLDMMRGVVEPGGTGVKAQIPEYPVAGKTGTGQKPHLRMRGYAENMWVGTFFGVAPVDEPELAVLVLVDEPQGKRYGGVVAAPAFREIMRGALRRLGVPSPMDAGKQVAWIDPETLARRRAIVAPVRRRLSAEAPPVDPGAAGDVPVPDFRGSTMDAVRRAAAEVGLLVHLVGSGTARSQDLSPQTRVPAGSEVTVVFEPRAPGASLAIGTAAGPRERRPPGQPARDGIALPPALQAPPALAPPAPAPLGGAP